MMVAPQSPSTTDGADHTGSTARAGAGVLIGLQIAILLSALDQTVLNVAIPKLSALLDGVDKSSWIITAYLLFATVATPLAGRLSDIYGVKRILIGATVLFTIASVLCGSAGLIPELLGLSAIDQLILARALQGTAGGAMIGLSFVAIGELFPARERGKYQGFIAAAYILAAIVGPVLGGWLTESLDWRYIFYGNIPLGIAAAILIATFYPATSRERAQASIDYAGTLLFVLFLIPLIHASSALGKLGALEPTTINEFGMSAFAFVTFIYRESLAKEPLIPLKMFKNRLVAISLATVFVTGIGLFGSMLLMATMLQEVVGMSATISGATLTPLMFVVAGASIAGGYLMSKTGKYKIMCVISLCLVAAGTALLSTLAADAPVELFLTYATIGGLGLGLLLPVHSIIIQNMVPAHVMGVATSMTQLFRSLGGTIGTGMMSAFVIGMLRHGSLHHAISTVLTIYACTAALAVVLNLFLPEIALKKQIT